MSWKKITLGRGNRKEISFLRNNYVRFGKEFINKNSLENMKYVSMMVQEDTPNIKIAFIFSEEKTIGAGKISKNKSGIWYCYVKRLFETNNLNIEKIEKKAFSPKEEKIEDEKAFVIEIKKEGEDEI